MLYHVSRAGQMYGPYTLEDLRRYVGTGNVLSTDMVRADGAAEWMTVAQVLGDAAGPPAYPVAGGYPVPAAVNPNLYPDPPNLAWGLVVLFTILTCGLFMVVWNLILSAWMRRVQPNSQALFLYIGGTVLTLLNSGASIGFLVAMQHHMPYQRHPWGIGLGLISWVVRLLARFNMKASLEEHYNGPEPLGLRLNGVMTFFFGGVYFQSELNHINAIKRSLRYGAGPL